MYLIEFDSFTLPKKKGLNQDSVIFGTHQSIHYFGVADGVGGSVGGGIASQVAVMQAEATIKESSTDDMTSIFRSVHKKMEEVAKKDKHLQSMATTFTLCLLENNTVRIGHVGDTRLYILRGNNILYKTEDHTLYNTISRRSDKQSLLNLKNMYSNVLSSSLCPMHQYELFTTKFSLTSGDRVVVCSDGVYKVISDEELLMMSTGSSTMQSLALKVKAVLRIRGVIDDSSLICVEIK